MHTVLKEILFIGDNTVCAPPDAEFVKCGHQDGQLVIWFVTNSQYNSGRAYDLVVVGTGHVFDATNLEYIDTVQMPSGLVWHVFLERTS